MDYIIYFIITIAILVFVHELGHFAAAKLSGMRADIFAIGFGKRLFGYNKLTGFTFGDLPKDFDGQGNTDYRLCLLPLGGYVKIAGMVDESFDTEFADKEPAPYEFRSKSVAKKVFVISAGVLMNLLLSLLVFSGMKFINGEQIILTTTVGVVPPNSLADSLGFRQNDEILAINNAPVNNWNDLRTELVINTLGEDINIELLRNGEKESIFIPRENAPEEDQLLLIPKGWEAPVINEVFPGSVAERAGLKEGDRMLYLDDKFIINTSQFQGIVASNRGKEIPLVVQRDNDTVNLGITPGEDGLIGISFSNVFTGEIEQRNFGFFASFAHGWDEIVRLTDLTFTMIGKVFSGNIEFGKAFGGPVKIAQIAARSADSGLMNFLYFLGLLSLSLAIINIMPFPVLDGGHLIIILVEGIMRREIPVKVKVAIQNAGFVVLLLLMAFIIYNDILSL